MFLNSDFPKKIKIWLVGIGVFLLSIAVVLIFGFNMLLTPAQRSRLDYFNPCSKYEDSGYQICNAFIAINNGGLTGLGIGKSTQKYSYIPEPHTDMVFAIIAEEQGVLKCSLIFIAYIISI